MSKLDVQVIQYAKRLPEGEQALFHSAWTSKKKDPNAAMLLSLLMLLGFAGVGRVYIGDIGLGIAMFFLGWITCGIWPIVDVFLISSAVDKKNLLEYEKLKAQFPAYR